EDRGRPLRCLPQDRRGAREGGTRPSRTGGHRCPVLAADLAGYTRRIRQAAPRHTTDGTDQRRARFRARDCARVSRRALRAPRGAALRGVLERRAYAEAAGRDRRSRMAGARRLSPSRKEVHVATLATATVFLALALPAPLLVQAAPSNVPPARDPRTHAIAGAPQADRIERDIRTLVG